MGASSWKETDHADLKMWKDVETILLHMCARNQTARDEFGGRLLLGPSVFSPTCRAWLSVSANAAAVTTGTCN